MIIHYEKDLTKALDEAIIDSMLNRNRIARIDLDEIETREFLDLYPGLEESGAATRNSPPYAPGYYTYYYKMYELKLAKV